MTSSTTQRSLPSIDDLLDRIRSRKCVLGIIGLGYVGIPLALAALKANYRVLGFDIDAQRVEQLNRGNSQIKHLSDDLLKTALSERRFEATADLGRLSEPDAIMIAVPTPLTKQREPDLSYVVRTAQAIAACLRPGQLIILESTTWPGTTREVLKPVLEASGLRCGEDFFLAFSPEREDPGNQRYSTASIPKVVGGEGDAALDLALALYASLVVETVAVSSSATAEAVKLTENIFRSVNIALVNELKVIFEKMGIDVWEVIDAAKTKPFGFMPFYPGPGLGGHCIPIDPFYLTWKAREYGVATRFIELAGEINTAMPATVVSNLALALDARFGRGLRDARILVLGLAYKKNIDDQRESPSLVIIELLQARGAAVDYHDPHIPVVQRTREHAALTGMRSQPIDPARLADYDAALVATDHDAVDYAMIAKACRLVVDTRNAFETRGIRGAPNVVKS